MKKIVIALCFVSLLSLKVQAQQPPPHMDSVMPGVEKGILDGVLVVSDEGKKEKPIPNQAVVLMVFQNGERILMLNKETDAAGKFQFKNIFKDEQFEYALGTMVEEQPYLMSGIRMNKSQESLQVRFVVGKGSPYKIDRAASEHEHEEASPGSMQGMNAASNTRTPLTAQSFWAKSYQKMAIILAGIVSLIVLAFILRKGFSA